MTKRLCAAGALALVLGFGLAACSDPYDPTQRAIAGGAIGAGSGAAIGALAGGGTGAAIGAGVGAVAGAVTGVVTTPEPQAPPPPVR
jgi:YMGG-like Gly-zipper